MPRYWNADSDLDWYEDVGQLDAGVKGLISRNAPLPHCCDYFFEEVEAGPFIVTGWATIEFGWREDWIVAPGFKIERVRDDDGREYDPSAVDQSALRIAICDQCEQSIQDEVDNDLMARAGP